MGYLPDQLEAKCFENRVPLDVSFELTHRCNLVCKICYHDPQFHKNELSTHEIKRILDQLSKAGTLFVTFTGGEPFLRHDVFNLLDHATINNFAVTLKTNGTLIDQAAAKKLKAFNLREVHISLLGATAKVHERITGIKGSFNRAIQAIRFLKSQNIRVATMSVITKESIGEFEKLRQLVRDLQVDNMTYTSIIFPKNNGDRSPLAYRLSDSELRRFYHIMKPDGGEDQGCSATGLTAQEKEDDLTYSCSVGRNGFSLDPYGKVMPCLSLRMEIGDMKIQAVKKIIRSSILDGIIEQVRLKNNPQCFACKDNLGCFRCPGMAFLENGNATAAPSEGCRQKQVQKEVIDE